MNLRIRVVVVLCIVTAGLVPLQAASRAQGSGSELAEAVTADASGGDASLVLTSAEAFPADGGQAVLEPGTDYAETFTYTSVDAGSNRLIGLTRPAPLAHAAGVFVQAPQPEAASPTSEPMITPTPPPADDGPPSYDEPSQGSESEDEGETGNESAVSDSGAPPEPCEPVLDTSCAEILGQLIADPCADLMACELVDDLELGDPVGDLCDPDDTGQACLEFIGDILGELVNDDVCDPDNTGQTCAEYLNGSVNDLWTQCEQLTDCEGALAYCGLSQPVSNVVLEDAAPDALACLGETVPMTGVWIEPPIIIPLVETDGSLHPCTVNPVIDEVSYNHGWFATNVDVRGDSHIESDCRTLVEDLHAEVHITTSTRTQILSPLGSSRSSDSCDSETPGTCNTHLLHQYPALDAWPSTIAWRFYFSWEVPAHDNFIFEIERCYRAVFPFGNISALPCQPGAPIE